MELNLNNMNKTLIIVDAQYDFMEGGKLPVQGATKALDNIVEYLNSGEISTVITTQDWHCGMHESFISEGGQFPEHCIRMTHGSRIYQPILDAIHNNNIFAFNLRKGHYTEEFTAFKYLTRGYNHWKEYSTTDYTEPYIQFHEEEIVQICGLAGDICVMQTAIVLKDLKPVIIESMTASLNVENFRKLADLNGITII